MIMEYRLEDIFELQMGKTPSRNNPEYWNSGNHKWISIGDLSNTLKTQKNIYQIISQYNENGEWQINWNHKLGL